MALRSVQVAGKTTPVIDTRATAARKSTSSSASCGAETRWLNEHMEVGRTVSVEGLPKAQMWTDPQGETHVWLEVHTHYVEFLNHGRGEQAGADTHVEPSGEAECPFYARPWRVQLNTTTE